MSAHTPGPWHALPDPQHKDYRATIAYVGDDWRVASDDYDYRSLGEIEADARLIAAAPDLYEALKGVLRVADRATDEFDAARAALRKARGES